MVNFKEIYHFSRFQRGSNIFQGGGGEGSNSGLYSKHVPIVPVLVESWSGQVNSVPW